MFKLKDPLRDRLHIPHPRSVFLSVGCDRRRLWNVWKHTERLFKFEKCVFWRNSCWNVQLHLKWTPCYFFFFFLWMSDFYMCKNTLQSWLSANQTIKRMLLKGRCLSQMASIMTGWVTLYTCPAYFAPLNKRWLRVRLALGFNVFNP